MHAAPESWSKYTTHVTGLKKLMFIHPNREKNLICSKFERGRNDQIIKDQKNFLSQF